jgi:hypothetical protein
MRLAAVNPRIDFNLDSLFATEVSIQILLFLYDLSFFFRKGKGGGEYELFWLLLLTHLRFLLGRCFSIYSLAALCFIEHHVPLGSCYTVSYASLLWWFWIDDYFLINTSVDWQ